MLSFVARDPQTANSLRREINLSFDTSMTDGLRLTERMAKEGMVGKKTYRGSGFVQKLG
jgi:hypothetical protein